MKGPDGKYLFGLVKIGDKGQIVIPKEAREVFGLAPGDQLLLLGDIKQGLALVDPAALKLFERIPDVMSGGIFPESHPESASNHSAMPDQTGQTNATDATDVTTREKEGNAHE